MFTRIITASLIAAASVFIAAAPAQAAQTPVRLALEIQGPDGVFVPVASGARFAVSSATPTVARWTITNPLSVDTTGYYLYSYGPDCAVSDLTIVALGTYVCTETIAPSGPGERNLGALGGLFDGTDFAIAYPLVINTVDDTNGQSFALSATTVKPGDALTLSGVGFNAADALTASIGTQSLGAISGESFSQTVTIPAGTAPGAQSITLYSNGVAYAQRAVVVIGPAAVVPAPALAATGVEADGMLLFGGILLLAGFAAALVRRRQTA